VTPLIIGLIKERCRCPHTHAKASVTTFRVYNYVGTGVQLQSEWVYNNRRNMHSDKTKESSCCTKVTKPDRSRVSLHAKSKYLTGRSPSERSATLLRRPRVHFNIARSEIRQSINAIKAS
jgi:hypothetical protein